MRAGVGFAVSLMAWALVAGTAVAAPPMQIKFAEAVSLPAAAGNAQFDAYGRRFELTLEGTDRLLKSLPVSAVYLTAVSQPLPASVSTNSVPVGEVEPSRWQPPAAPHFAWMTGKTVSSNIRSASLRSAMLGLLLSGGG